MRREEHESEDDFMGRCITDPWTKSNIPDLSERMKFCQRKATEGAPSLQSLIHKNPRK